MNTAIFVVEDNPIHATLLKYAFACTPEWQTALTIATDGDAAVQYLSSDGALPDLIILDAEVPKKDGLDILKVIKGLPRYDPVPVIMFSSLPEETIRSRVTGENLAADFYLSKPTEPKSFSVLALTFRRYYEEARRAKKYSGQRQKRAGSDHN